MTEKSVMVKLQRGADMAKSFANFMLSDSAELDVYYKNKVVEIFDGSYYAMLNGKKCCINVSTVNGVSFSDMSLNEINLILSTKNVEENIKSISQVSVDKFSYAHRTISEQVDRYEGKLILECCGPTTYIMSGVAYIGNKKITFDNFMNRIDCKFAEPISLYELQHELFGGD